MLILFPIGARGWLDRIQITRPAFAGRQVWILQNGFLYLEQPNRISGIRVIVDSYELSSIRQGTSVTLIVTLSTTPAHERQLIYPTILATTP